MGFFDWFHKSGKPVGAETVVKRMSASARDFEGVGLDDEEHPSDVFECGKIDVTGMRGKDTLYPCREKVSSLCNRIKKKQVVAYYLSPHKFSLSFGWADGGSVRMTASLDRTVTSSLPDWLLANVKTPGEDLTAEALGRLLDGKFSSENPPNWLVASKREDVAAPEPDPEPTDTPPLTIYDLKPGVMVFGHYRIEKELGSGGQGMVFLATDTQTVVEAHRRVVLKVLRCENCGDEASLQEFVTEANTLSSLRDDRIAACYWCKRLGDVPIMAMEYVEGVSLDKYLADQKDGKIGEQETRELLLPIAEALDYAHAKGIYHRDVKPQNIIVRATPKKIGNRMIRTCLLDFGIASRDHGGSVQTTFRSFRGTLQYMPPDRRPSASMDIYSLAVTAYECLSGEMPYPNGWDPDVTVEPLASDTPFAKAVMRGLAERSKDRPATCAELINPPVVKIVTPEDGTTKEQRGKAGGGTGGGTNKTDKGSSKTIVEVPDDFSALAELFNQYRRLLNLSAQKWAMKDERLADWLRNCQTCLRDLTKDIDNINAVALEQFFVDIKNRMGDMRPEEFFDPFVFLNQLRLLLPEKGGRVWRALKGSIGK